MSRTISFAERESFHVPANRLAQPFLLGAGSSLILVMEELNKAISSIFSLLLKSFSSCQNLAVTGEAVVGRGVFIVKGVLYDFPPQK